ncbi:hypothetical protein BDB01DRAFT_109794 [Pilobolus umbonatus]|nr:hypothetical protein BDB01DRAFT_109794 [Pilobolus umbonatus]
MVSNGFTTEKLLPKTVMMKKQLLPPVKRRKRIVVYSWYIDYNCHSGKKEEKLVWQKACKKSNCPARLKVTCFKNNPNMVTLETVNEHNHAIGGSDDIKHLPLSREAREYIEGRLREGYRKRDTRLSIQKNYGAFMQSLSIGDSLESSTVLHRDQFVHADEIYNI